MAQMLVSYKSVINRNTEITLDKWGITLLNKWHGGKIKAITGDDIPHCEILVEGLTDVGKFAKIIDLDVRERTTEPDFLTSRTVAHIGVNKFEPDHLQEVKSHSKTWLVSKDKVNEFITEKEKEKDMEQPFLIFGGDSFLSSRTETFDIHHPLLVAISRSNRKLFTCLYDSSRNNGLCTGMSKKSFEIEIKKTMKLIAETKSKRDPTKMKYLKEEDSWHLLTEYKYEDLIKMMNVFVDDPQKITQESCVTWAQRQCQSLGILVEKNAIDALITLPPMKCKTRKGSTEEPEYVEDKNIPQVNSNSKNDLPLSGRHVSNNHNRIPTPEEIKKIVNKAHDNLASIEKHSGWTGAIVGVPCCLGAAVMGAGPIGVGGGLLLGHITDQIYQRVALKNYSKTNDELVAEIMKDEKLKEYAANHPEKLKLLDPKYWQEHVNELRKERTKITN